MPVHDLLASVSEPHIRRSGSSGPQNVCAESTNQLDSINGSWVEDDIQRISASLDRLLTEDIRRRRMEQMLCAWAIDPQRRQACELLPLGPDDVWDKNDLPQPLRLSRLEAYAIMGAVCCCSGQCRQRHWITDRAKIHKKRYFFLTKLRIPFASLIDRLRERPATHSIRLNSAFELVRLDLESIHSEALRRQAMSWFEAQRRIQELINRGCPFSTIDLLERLLNCSRSTVQKAIHPPVGAIRRLPPGLQTEANQRSRVIRRWQCVDRLESFCDEFGDCLLRTGPGFLLPPHEMAEEITRSVPESPRFPLSEPQYESPALKKNVSSSVCHRSVKEFEDSPDSRSVRPA